jgi:septal ring-binding cell division protein DamX
MNGRSSGRCRSLQHEHIKYTVQLLSIGEFSQSRLNIYCKQHKLSVSDVKKKQVGEWMKITYGEANSIQEAAQIKEKLKQNHGIKDAFVVQIK